MNIMSLMDHTVYAIIFCFDRDYHCGLIGYKVMKAPRPMTHQVTPSPKSDRGPGIYQPVVLTRDSLPSFHQNTVGKNSEYVDVSAFITSLNLFTEVCLLR